MSLIPRWRALGFQWGTPSDLNISGFEVAIPNWFLTLLAAPLPVAWAVRAARNSRARPPQAVNAEMPINPVKPSTDPAGGQSGMNELGK